MNKRAVALLLACAPLQCAEAHSFGKLYTLPVPVWLYLYGAAAALLLSFLVIGWFIGTPQDAHRNFATRPLPRQLGRLQAPAVVLVLRVLGVGLLLLCIATGLFGSGNPYANFNMTFFWIVFALGYAYLVALLGDSYPLLNPWAGLLDGVQRLWSGAWRGRRAYPERLGYAPALILYMAFIWIELFARIRPFSLATVLLGYTLISLLGAWWWGRDAWLRYGDFFGVLFRILGRMAPLAWVDGRYVLRQPFIGLLDERCERLSLLLFVLFMLSSTAFDGIHETVPWARVFWQGVAPALKPLIGGDIVQTFPLLKRVYAVWQTLAMVLSPFVYLAIYAALIALAKRLAGSERSVRELCLDFGYCLVPIALVYNITHYYTLLVTQGLLIVRLASDPFGFGWNLFGTARWHAAPVVLDAGTVWHTQVALILLGHIVSVYLAHLVALRVFVSPRRALVSQLPLLVLMVAYTTIGLWILSLPIQAGVYVP
ncbi:MAG TPA: hypothetical protein VM074_02470 [Solimonas sp.]|nr:hypothetical protein [Solimonas sp.]